MNITIKQLRGFVAIAECGSFAQACAQLHVSQPALTVTIQKLEQQLGGQLLARSTRSVTLTPEGQVFLPTAQRLLHDWQAALADIQQLFSLQQGKLTIAAMPSYASSRLPMLLHSYQQHYPGINITVQDIVMEEVITAVQHGRVDLGITFEQDSHHGVQFTPLYQEQFVALVPQQHQLANAAAITLRELFKQPLIALNPGSATRLWTEQAIAASGVTPPKVYDAFQLTTVGAMVAAGMGVALVPALCQSQMQQLGAVCRPVHGPGICKMLGVYTHPRQPLSSAAQEMLLLLRSATN